MDAAFNTMANLYVADFVKNFGIGYPVGYSTPEEVMSYLGRNIMERYTVPQIIWIDRRGNIRSETPSAGDDPQYYTEGYWRNMIETLLKEPAASTTHHTRLRQSASRSRRSSGVSRLDSSARRIITTERP